MQFNSLVLSLLQAQFWSITPALPGTGVGTRPAVGFPEVIPDVTFIAREVTAADGFPDPAQRNRLNDYIRAARRFHVLYGLTPRAISSFDISSFDDVLRHFQAVVTPVGRVRIVSHGDDAFLFLPMFTGGMWDFGIDTPLLAALRTSDEAGLRLYITRDATAPQSPTLIDGVDAIVAGMRELNNGVLVPFGLGAAGSPTGELLKFFEVVNDQYQVLHGAIGITVGPRTVTMTAPQQAIMNTALGQIETSIRRRLIGTVIAGNAVTGPQLDALRAAVLAATPPQLGMLGPPADLPATVAADVAAQMGGPVDTREQRLRVAIVGVNQEPLLGPGVVGAMVDGLKLFQPAALTLGGTDHDETSIGNDRELEAYFVACLDLHFLRNGTVTVDRRPSIPAQRLAVRNGLVAITDLISTRIRARGGNTITPAELTTLRTAIETRPLRESVVTGGTLPYPDAGVFNDLTAATRAMAGDAFRARYDHFRGLMQPADASTVDIRGCLVGVTPAYLTALRDFMGGAADKPVVTAPNWFQSYPGGFHPGGLNPTTFGEIDTIVARGLPPRQITDADVARDFLTWRGLIDFDPHFDFIEALFAAGASLRDFASLDWRVFRSGAAPAGIPILKMEATRIDTLPALANLEAVIERFRAIFEIPSATPPNAAARGRLTRLQPHVAHLKRIDAAIAAGPGAGQLPQILADLTTVATGVSGIVGPGFPAPAPPLTPPAAPVLQDLTDFATAIGTHVDAVLTANLGAFFTAVRAATGDANARFHYYFNIGLPLLVQSAAAPTSFTIFLFASAPTSAAAGTVIGQALRSWMRIQWTGTAAQGTAMNGVITRLNVVTHADRTAASQVAMLSEDVRVNPAAAAGIAPLRDYHDHIVRIPP